MTVMEKLSPTSVFKSVAGFELPVIGLGTWQCTGIDGKTAVDTALEAGYRLIDTAFNYENEEVIGDVLRQWFSNGKLKREDLFITTKLPNNANNPKLVREHLEKSLKALKVDYVDLYLIHHPVGVLPTDVVKKSDGSIDFNTLQLDLATDHVQIWKEMEKQVDYGLTKAIGLSNFNIRQIERVMKNARIPPANLQIELHLYNQWKAMQEFCKSKGITLTSYSTLGSPGAPEYLKASQFRNPMEDPAVVRISKVHATTPALVLLRHMLQLGVAVIPKSVISEEIQQNMKVFDFELNESEIEELNGLDKGEEGRLYVLDYLKAHPEYPFL